MTGCAIRWPLRTELLILQTLTAHQLHPFSSLANSLNPKELFPSPRASLLPMTALFLLLGGTQTPGLLVSIQISLKDDVRVPSVQSHSPPLCPQVLFLRSVSSKTSTHKFLPSSVFLGQLDQQTLRIWNDLWRFWFSFGAENETAEIQKPLEKKWWSGWEVPLAFEKKWLLRFCDFIGKCIYLFQMRSWNLPGHLKQVRTTNMFNACSSLIWYSIKPVFNMLAIRVEFTYE